MHMGYPMKPLLFDNMGNSRLLDELAASVDHPSHLKLHLEYSRLIFATFFFIDNSNDIQFKSSKLKTIHFFFEIPLQLLSPALKPAHTFILLM